MLITSPQSNSFQAQLSKENNTNIKSKANTLVADVCLSFKTLQTVNDADILYVAVSAS